jgi:hypothetical protein
MEEGRVQAITSVAVDGADQAFDQDGDAVLAADFEKIEGSTYLEWGVTPRLTLIAQPVVQRVSLRQSPDAPIEEATGFASSQLGARVLLARPFGGVMSLQGAAVAPGAVENVINARLGDGGAAADLRLLAGRGWGGERRGVYVDSQVGYRWRFDDYPEEARFDATFGVRASPDWMLITQSFSVWREEEPNLLLPESRVHKAQVSVVRRLNETWSLQVGGYGAYAGRNVVEERAAFASLWMRFRP